MRCGVCSETFIPRRTLRPAWGSRHPPDPLPPAAVGVRVCVGRGRGVRHNRAPRFGPPRADSFFPAAGVGSTPTSALGPRGAGVRLLLPATPESKGDTRGPGLETPQQTPPRKPQGDGDSHRQSRRVGDVKRKGRECGPSQSGTGRVGREGCGERVPGAGQGKAGEGGREAREGRWRRWDGKRPAKGASPG